MPYTEAVLLEIFRVSNVIPLVHRVAMKNTTIGGYSIRKVRNQSVEELKF